MITVRFNTHEHAAKKVLQRNDGDQNALIQESLRAEFHIRNQVNELYSTLNYLHAVREHILGLSNLDRTPADELGERVLSILDEL